MLAFNLQIPVCFLVPNQPTNIAGKNYILKQIMSKTCYEPPQKFRQSKTFTVRGRTAVLKNCTNMR